MKKKLVILLGITLLLTGIITGSSTIVKAAKQTNTELKLVWVSDIEAWNDYSGMDNELPFNTLYTDERDGLHIYRITLEEDGFVKLLVSAQNMVKIVTGKGGTTSSAATLTATVYRDAKLLYPVMPAIAAKGGISKESTQKYALDKGTYYVTLQTDPYSQYYTNNQFNETKVEGKALFIVYYQEVASHETFRPSSVGKENLITFETVFKSLLTVPNPKDYYTFDLTDKALLKINFMYESTKNAKFVLYGPDWEQLVIKSFQGGNVWYNVEKYLEPGTYYCSLETTTLNDGGRTNLLINQTVYPLLLEQENEDVNSYITVETIDQPKEIRYLQGKLTNSELASSKWSRGKIITEDKQFGVNMTGYYTVRVTDEYDNMFMQSIRVTECDKKAPKKPAIKTYAAESILITGTAEKDSKVTVTVDKKQYAVIANEKGTYTCDLAVKLVKGNRIEVISQDISGNTSEKTVVLVK